MTQSDQSRIAVGIMTGTSLDALDACALHVHGHGLDMTTEQIGFISHPLDELGDSLRAIAADEPTPASVIAARQRALGERCRDAIQALQLGPHIDLIAVHGQTVHHAPPDSWQLIDPFPIAQHFGTRVVSGLRGLDRAAGGEGAPITPLADWILHRTDTTQTIVNLGGFINCTILPAQGHEDPMQAIAGFDVCPCNHLLDTIARLALDAPYDDGGRLALSGNACLEQLQMITAHLCSLHEQNRSLGSDDDCIEFVPDILQSIGAADASATFCAAIAATLTSALAAHPAEIVRLAGGGTRNAALTQAITAGLGEHAMVEPLHHGDEREAASMAVLGALADDDVPITLPQVTGRNRTHVRDGTWVRAHDV